MIIVCSPSMLMLCMELGFSPTLLMLFVELIMSNFGGKYIYLNETKSVECMYNNCSVSVLWRI